MKSQPGRILLTTLILTLFTGLIPGVDKALAQKESDSAGKQASETEINEGIANAKKSIDELTKKIYAKSLFSPQDNDKLIGLKILLYQLWEKNPTNRALAEPLYNTAIILAKRELYEDSIDVLNIVIESFPPLEEAEEEGVTIDYSSKAQKILTKIQEEQNKN